MRLLMLSCALLLLACLNLATDAQQGNLEGAKANVDRYVDPETPAAERASLRDVLFLQSKRDVARAIQSNLKNVEAREHCLRLILDLQIPGMFNPVRRYLPEEPLQVTAIGLLSRDSTTLRTLLRDWRNAEDGGAVFTSMAAAFSRYPMELDQLAEFRKIGCQDEQTPARVKACLDIIEAQIGKRAESAAALDAEYDAWVAQIRDDVQRFPPRGFDAMALEGWRKDGARNILGNHILEGRGSLLLSEPLGPRMHDPGYTVSIRAKASEDLKASFVIVMDQDGHEISYGLEAKDGNITQMLGQGNIRPATVKPGRWVEIAWVVEQKPEAAVGKCWLKLMVDRHVVNSGVVFDGEVSGLQIKCESGRLVIANVEYIRN